MFAQNDLCEAIKVTFYAEALPQIVCQQGKENHYGSREREREREKGCGSLAKEMKIRSFNC